MEFAEDRAKAVKVEHSSTGMLVWVWCPYIGLEVVVVVVALLRCTHLGLCDTKLLSSFAALPGQKPTRFQT